MFSPAAHYENRDKLAQVHAHVQSYIDSYRLLQMIRVDGRVIHKGTYIQARAARLAGLDKMPTVAQPCDRLGHPIGMPVVSTEPPVEVSETNDEVRKFGTSKFNRMFRFNMPTDDHIRMATKDKPFVPPEPIVDIVMPVAGAAAAPHVEVGPDVNAVPAQAAVQAPSSAAPPAVVEPTGAPEVAPVTVDAAALAPRRGRRPKAEGDMGVAVVPAAPAAIESPSEAELI